MTGKTAMTMLSIINGLSTRRIPAMTVDANEPRTRRALLSAAVGAAAVAAAAAMPASVAAHDVDDVSLGGDNTATARTKITASVAYDQQVDDDQASIVGSNGNGSGVGVMGRSSPGGFGVLGSAPSGIGVWGRSGTDWGVLATGQNGGLHATGPAASSIGVWGHVGDDGSPPPQGVGIVGGAFDDVATGMIAYLQVMPAAIPGVALQVNALDPQTALQVTGKVKFSRAGKASMSSTQTSKAITKAGVTSSSYVLATLQTRVTGLFILAVVPTAGKFTIYLNKAPGKTIYIGYLVIN
jgi:hypothetical protein